MRHPGLLSFIFLLPFVPVYAQEHVNCPDIFIIDSIVLKGNEKTKEAILLRELTFSKGDTLNGDEYTQAIETSRINLLNLSLFHTVDFDIYPHKDEGHISLYIRVQERWYTWLWPVLEIYDPNFNTWYRKRDLTRLSYGLFLQQENFRGRMEKLHLIVKLGYQQEMLLHYEKPYINSAKTLGAGTQIRFARDREIGYLTQNNKLEYYRGDDFMRQVTTVSANLRYRKRIHTTHFLQLSLNWFNISDSLLLLNPAYNANASRHTFFPALSYFVKADYRDDRAYPLSGWYADAMLTHYGLGMVDAIHFATLRTSVRWHQPAGKRWNIAFLLASKFSTSGLKPYYLSRALGYERDYVRGYEYYVVDGDHFTLAKANLKYNIVKPGTFHLRCIKSPRFNTIPYAIYLNAFADAGKQWPGQVLQGNNLSGKMLSGIGLGIDFVTYYDKVLRAEISRNAKGETGFFLHFMAAI